MSASPSRLPRRKNTLQRKRRDPETPEMSDRDDVVIVDGTAFEMLPSPSRSPSPSACCPLVVVSSPKRTCLLPEVSPLSPLEVLDTSPKTPRTLILRSRGDSLSSYRSKTRRNSDSFSSSSPASPETTPTSESSSSGGKVKRIDAEMEEESSDDSDDDCSDADGAVMSQWATVRPETPTLIRGPPLLRPTPRALATPSPTPSAKLRIQPGIGLPPRPKVTVVRRGSNRTPPSLTEWRAPQLHPTLTRSGSFLDLRSPKEDEDRLVEMPRSSSLRRAPEAGIRSSKYERIARWAEGVH